MSAGKLRDALPLLEAIRPTDPERGEADRLASRHPASTDCAGSPARHARQYRVPRSRGFSDEVSQVRISGLRAGRAVPELRLRILARLRRADTRSAVARQRKRTRSRSRISILMDAATPPPPTRQVQRHRGRSAGPCVAERTRGIAAVRPTDHRRRSAHHEGVAAASAALRSPGDPGGAAAARRTAGTIVGVVPETTPTTPPAARPIIQRSAPRCDSDADQRRRHGRTCRHSPSGPAAVIDVALLALVDFVVVYFTIKICPALDV